MPLRRPVCGVDPGNPRLLPMLTPEKWAKVARELHLTPRQAEIVHLVLQAKKDKEVAAALRLGVSTVRMHLRYAFKQLGITDRMELALLVFRKTCRHCQHMCPPHGQSNGISDVSEMP